MMSLGDEARSKSLTEKRNAERLKKEILDKKAQARLEWDPLISEFLDEVRKLRPTEHSFFVTTTPKGIFRKSKQQRGWLVKFGSWHQAIFAEIVILESGDWGFCPSRWSRRSHLDLSQLSQDKSWPWPSADQLRRSLIDALQDIIESQ